RGARGEALGAAGGAHERHQRGPREENPERLRPADHLGGQHGRGGGEGGGCSEGEEMKHDFCCPPVKGGSERFLRAGGSDFLKTNPPLRLRLTAPLTGGRSE